MFSTRLLALIVAATAASSVQGKTVSLVSRQLAPAIPGIPVPCQPVCVVFTALQQSITPQQLCTPANAANIQRCAQCIMTMNTSSVIGNGDLMTQLQTAVNSFTNACAAAQVPVPPITLVNPLTQQPLLGTGTLPTPGLPLPGAPGAAPLPPGAPGAPGAGGGLSPSETAPFMPQEIRKDVTIKGTHNIPMAPIGQTPGAALPVPGAPVPGVPAPVPGAPVVPGLPIPGQQGQVVQPGTQLLQQPGQVPPVPPVAAAPPVGVPGIQSQRATRVRRSLPNNPISLLRRLESSSSSSSATASSPSSPKSNGTGAGMDTRKIVGLTVIGLLVSWVL